MRRALFLLHNYNDIDHMTPVIDALMRTGRWQCSVVSYPLATAGSVDFTSDWRFAYLQRTYGVSIDLIEKADIESRLLIALFLWRETLTAWCDRTPKIGRLFGKDLRGLLPWFLLWRFYDRLLALIFTRLSGLGRRMLKRYRPDVVAVDWGRSHGVIAPVLHAAARRGIRILQLPHGAWTYEGIYSHPSQFDPAKLSKTTRLPVVPPDAMVIDNVYKGMRSIVQGVSKDCLRLIGLARFTPQWQATLASLPKGTAQQPSDGRPRVVWFTTWLMASNLEATKATLSVLEDYADRIDVVLKVHTRNPANEQTSYGSLLRPGSRIRLVANEEESFAMTRWADLIMVTQSSIVYDAFLMGKPVLYLKHTHNFECIWETDRVGDIVTSVDTFRSKIDALARGAYRPEYAADAVDRFLRLLVCGGLAPDQVLPAYVDLFDQAAAGEPLTAGYGFDRGVADWQTAGRQIVSYDVPARERQAEPA